MDNLIRYTNQNKTNHVGEVDKENAIIYGVSLITGEREATGHGEYIDSKTVDQVVKFGKETGTQGLKARFDHPQACGRSMGTAIGRFKNFRRDDDQARADLHLLDSAVDTPDGDLLNYTLNLAKEDPNIFATSIVFKPDSENMNAPNPEDHPDKDPDDAFFFPHTRLKALYACDVVDEGASNDGLFGRKNYWVEQAERWAKENPEALNIILDKYFTKNNFIMKDDKSNTKEENKDSKSIKEIVTTALKSVLGDKEENKKFTKELEAKAEELTKSFEKQLEESNKEDMDKMEKENTDLKAEKAELEKKLNLAEGKPAEPKKDIEGDPAEGADGENIPAFEQAMQEKIKARSRLNLKNKKQAEKTEEKTEENK